MLNAHSNRSTRLEVREDTSKPREDSVELSCTLAGPTHRGDWLDKGKPIPFWQRKLFTVPVNTEWQAPVKCKMNIGEWEASMRDTGLEKDVGYITNGFKNRFCLGIPQHKIEGMRLYTPENHKSAVVARQQIGLTLEK